ncbi:MAG: ATP-dependent helicase HrpB [Bacteroidetes bacterium HGW-Bacteroidetes-22]|nr:MAG: ATP-dependent helicase HrpB [Bacteroidetes bacterium HGW-Bacteroidetes-22]
MPCYLCIMNPLLPIESLREEICQTLAKGHQLILKAPPGSGKSTMVPQFIFDSVISAPSQIWILQPRRMATRMLARYVASLRGRPLGQEVGYLVRNERQAGSSTRILFVTEGVLMRRLLSGDHLLEVGAVVFDEFHERHAETDITLALALQLQQTFRPDLKIIVMSATLNTQVLTGFMPGAVVLETKGRLFPVNIRYVPGRRDEQVWEAAALQLEAFRQLLQNGTALVFMPGAFEIRKTIEAISRRSSLAAFDVCPLYGSLSGDEQEAAVRAGKPKIIVSTNVAETSITIPGVTLVVDSGMVRVSRFDPRREIDTLHTEFISRSSSDQRAGRAGRTADGTCIRLWSEFHHQQLAETDTPGIYLVDMAGVLLGLINNPDTDLETFNWIEAPKKDAVAAGFSLLQRLKALSPDLKITETGRKMAQFPLHPRYARLFVEAEKEHCAHFGAIAAVLAESDALLIASGDQVIRQERLYHGGTSDSDLIAGVNLLIYVANNRFDLNLCRQAGINPNQARQLMESASQLLKLSGSRITLPDQSPSVEETEILRKCIFLAFADRVAVRPDYAAGSFRLSGGRVGRLSPDSLVQQARIVVVTDLEETKQRGGTVLTLRKVTIVDESWIIKLSEEGFMRHESVSYDKKSGRVIRKTEFVLNDMIFNRQITEDVGAEEIASVLAGAVLSGEIQFSQWDDRVEAFINRVNFAAANAPQYGLPVIDADARRFILEQILYGCRSLKEVGRADPWHALRGWLSVLQLSAVDVVAPETIDLPHRHRPVRLRYDVNGNVVLSETIQAFYDCPTPITVAEGRVEVMYELLSPARRPVQLTRNLEQFWKGSYLEIRKELKGRYPKHEWR